MSTDPAEQPGGPAAASGSAPGEPSEAELRAAYEAELSRITPAEVMLQSAVSLLNIGARRLGLTGAGAPAEAGGAAAGGTPPGSERDLVQVRDAIEGVRALLGILERDAPQELRPLRDALSQLQLAYAREAPAGAGAGTGDGSGSGDGSGTGDGPGTGDGQAATDPGKAVPPGDKEADAPGPAQSSGRLWVPGR